MNGHRPGNSADRAGADAELPGGFERPLPQARVRREAEGVVRRQVHDDTVIDRRLWLLFVFENTQRAVEPLRFHRLEFSAEIGERIASHRHGSRQRGPNSSSITDRIAVVGIARIAPTSPQSDPPMSSATITATGLTPTRRSMIFGTRIL